MAFPTTPLPIVIELFIGGGWVDITDYVLVRDGIKISRGFRDEGGGDDPSSCELTLNNRDGRFSPRNPAGTYYGLIGRNTPLRVGIQTVTAAESGSDAGSISSFAAPSVDLRRPAAGLLVSGWRFSVSGPYNVTLPGGMTSTTEVDGTTSTSRVGYELLSSMGASGTRTATVTASADVARAVSVVVPAATGVSETTQGYAAAAADLTLTTTSGVQEGQILLLLVGHNSPISLSSSSWQLHHSPDALPGWSVFTARASAGVNSVTVSSSTATKHGHLLVLSGSIFPPLADAVRFTGEVSEWPQRWDVSGRDVWVPVTAQGVLRRLGQGTSPARSPLSSSILNDPSNSVVGYWPLEDDGPSFASALPSGVAMVCTGDAPDAGSNGIGPILGSRAIPVLGATSSLMGTVGSYTSDDLVVQLIADFPSSPTWTDNTPVLWATQGGSGSTVARWEVRYQTAGSGSLQVRALDSSGSSLAASGTLATAVNGKQLGVRLQLLQVGSDVSWSLSTLQVNDAGDDVTWSSSSGTFAGLVLAQASSVQIAPSGGLTDLAVGHVVVASNFVFWLSALYGSIEPDSALLSFLGEPAGARAGRVCAEIVVPFTEVFADDVSETTPMGQQAIPGGGSDDTDATPLGVLVECAAADMGLIFESRDELGLTFRSQTSLLNQNPAATLDYDGAGEVAPDLQPIDDDQATRNDITVKGKQGGSARSVDTTSRMGAQDPADGGVGRYNDEVEVNVHPDVRLENLASWRLRLGTWDEVRWPAVQANLVALAKNGKWDLIGVLAELDSGDRFDLTNLPIWSGADGGTAELLALGFEEVLGPFDWNIAINSRPYGPWRIQKLANASPDLSTYVGRAAGDPNAAIRADINSSTTSIAFDPNMFRWTTTSSHFDTSNWPAMQVRLNHAQGVDGGGELLTVSAISTTAATYVAAGAASHADNAAVTPALYAGDAQGDWVCVLARKSGTSGSLATPTGYTLLAKQGLLYLWARVRGSSSPGNPTVTPSGGSAGDTVSAVTFGLRNMPITLSLDRYVLNAAKQSNSSAQNIAYLGRADPGVYPGVVQLLLAGKSDDDTGIAPPSGFTEAIDATTTTGNDQSLWVGYRIDTTPAAVAPGSLVVTGGAAAVSESMLITLAGGYQTMTATRAANDVTKAHSAGTLVALEHPLIQAL